MANREDSVEVHGYTTCPFAWRVRLVAAEKGVRAAWIPCDVDDPDPRAAAHNPDEHSPLLWHGGFSLLESEVIAAYLDEAFPWRALQAADPRARAEQRVLAVELRPLDVHMERARPLARRKAAPALQVVERRLAAAPFLGGEEPGLTDLLAWPFLADLAIRGLLGPDTPRVAAYVQRSAARPAHRDTRPPWATAL